MAHRYISGGNQPPGSAPLDVQNQQGELFSLVKSIQEAYMDIQAEQANWLFMMKAGVMTVPVNTRVITRDQVRKSSVNLADYQRIMPLLGNGARYILIGDGPASPSTTPNLGNSLNANSTATPLPCIYVPYQQWRGFKDKPPIRAGKPAFFTILPDESIAFDSVTQQVHNIAFDYRVKPFKLEKNEDVPVWDEDFHTVVAWRAVNLWGGRQTDASKFQFAAAEYQRVMGEMRSRYLPETVFSVGEFSGQSILTS